MTIPVKLKRSGTTTATPSSLEYGEIAINYADGVLFYRDSSDVIQSFTFQAYALASHTHAASDITSGTLDAARLPLATTGAVGGVIVGTGLGVSSGTVSVTYGTTSGTACQGNDSRLSDARTPTDGSVTTAKITNDAVTYAKLQNVSATDRLLGRSSAGSGDVEEITCTAFGRSLIDDADAAAARTTLSVQPTASPAFTGAATFDNTGNVVPLTVTNTGTANSFVVNDASGDTTPFVIDASGNVVCGSSTAKARLQTSGASAASPSLGSVTGSFLVTNSDTGYGMHFGVESSGVGWIQQGRTDGTATAYNLQLQPAGGQVLVPAGSASAPGVAFSGDPDTGIAQLSAAGANTLSICTNSAERVRVDASGNVGIGGTSGGNVLHVFGTTDSIAAFGQSTKHLRIGFDSTADRAIIESADFGTIAKNLVIRGRNIIFENAIFGVAEGMRLTDAHELLIGTTTDNGAYKLQVNSQIYATNATIATSDARFKTNVESLTDATAVIEALRPVAFDFIAHEERNFATERQVGLIAQEAQSALAGTDYAESVVAQCGDHLGLAYEKLVPVLIKALQESNARIAALEERINA